MHHRRVPSNLHLDPAVLRATAGAVAALPPLLRVPGLDPVDRAALAAVPGGAALLAEHDRITAAVARTGQDLDDLADEVRITVVHEFGHHVGIDDERLHELGWA